MQLTLLRYDLLNDRTLGVLYINDQQFCHVLEDKSRGLNSKMSLAEIKAAKVFGQTAIPTGTYEVVLSYSTRFKKVLPELLTVPGFSGIRIHAGNTPENTLGCLLVGKRNQNIVSESRVTMDLLMKQLEEAAKKEKLTITIIDMGQALQLALFLFS